MQCLDGMINKASDIGHLFLKVGDFGLARWQPDVDQGVETRAIGTFGYN